MFRKHWIPPLPLLFGQLSFVFSWLLLFDIGRRGAGETSFEAFAWVHAIVLGWVTTTALAVLIHVVPNFVDVEWRGEGVARASVPGFMAGVVILLAGFLVENVTLLQIGGILTLAALAAYVTCALTTLAQAFRGERVERAVARAFSLTLLFLIVTATLGAAFTFALGGVLSPRMLLHGPAAHAVLGIGGWLTLLVMGVSARTMRPMSGTRSRFAALHIGGSSALMAGIIVATVGILVASPAAAFTGFIIAGIGGLLYAIDIFDIVVRATNPHVAPRLLMFFGACCSVAAAVSAAFAVLGADVGACAVYLALIGWIGSAVVAHLHHLGIRLLITYVSGDDDETRPWEVLTPSLTWLTVALYVAAVLFGAFGWGLDSGAFVEMAGAAGVLSWIVMMGNVTRALRRLQSRDARSYSLL